MRLRSAVLLVVLVAAVATTAVSTQSSLNTEMERGVVVEVVADQQAYLGISRTTDDSQGSVDAVIDVTNNLPGDTTISVTVTPVADPANASSTVLDAGESHRFRFADVSCDDAFDVTATGQNVSIELTRSVPCDAA